MDTTLKITMPLDLPGVKPGSDLETLFKAVGFVVVQWASAEQSLDMLVVGIFHCCKSDSLPKRRPRNLEPKVELLQKCFSQLPELSQFKTEAGSLLPRFLAAGKIRNDLVHGAIADLESTGGTFTFAKLDLEPTIGHSVRAVRLSEAEWPAFRKELLHLGKDGIGFSRRVWDSLKVKA